MKKSVILVLIGLLPMAVQAQKDTPNRCAAGGRSSATAASTNTMK